MYIYLKVIFDNSGCDIMILYIQATTIVYLKPFPSFYNISVQF